MSFVFAYASTDLAFILADTFSENVKTKERFQPYTNPLVKVFPISDKYAVAFAGNSHLAQQCLRDITGDFDQIEDTLLQSHLRLYDESDDRGGVDYILCSRNIEYLSLIKGGKSLRTSVGHIGSKNAFEIFQRLRHRRDTGSGETEIHISRLVDNVNSKSNDIYAKCMGAFRETLIEHDETFGGYAIPFILSEHYTGYGAYTSNYRAPVTESEMPLFGTTALTHQDKYNGSFLIEFWGGSSAFATYFPSSQSGCVFEGFMKSGCECTRYQRIDGYDFTNLAERCGCPVGATSWRSWKNDLVKALRYIDQGETDKAVGLISAVAEIATASIAAHNFGQTLDFKQAIVEPLLNLKKLRIPVDTVNIITELARAQFHLATAQDSSHNTDHWKRELITWNALVDQMMVYVEFAEESRITG